LQSINNARCSPIRNLHLHATTRIGMCTRTTTTITGGGYEVYRVIHTKHISVVKH
jgi:hypothetical protein